MPKQDVRHIEDKATIGCWKLNETLEELTELASSAGIDAVPAHVTHEQKRKEWIAQRLIIKALEGENAGITHATTGAPILASGSEEQREVSISHCNNTIVVLTNNGPYCGIDIARIDARAGRIRQRFLSETENAVFGNNDKINTTLWACKEAAFKAYNMQGIVFREDIQIQSLDQTSATILLRKHEDAILSLGIEHTGNHVLVYTLNQ